MGPNPARARGALRPAVLRDAALLFPHLFHSPSCRRGKAGTGGILRGVLLGAEADARRAAAARWRRSGRNPELQTRPRLPAGSPRGLPRWMKAPTRQPEPAIRPWGPRASSWMKQTSLVSPPWKLSLILSWDLR